MLGISVQKWLLLILNIAANIFSTVKHNITLLGKKNAFTEYCH